MTPRRYEARALPYLLLAAMAFRLLFPLGAFIYAGDTGLFERPDTATYLEPGRSLVETGRYHNASGPELFRTPAYSLFLGLAFASGYLHLVVIVLQALLGTATTYLVFRIAHLFGDPQAAVFAAGFYAFEPMSILFCSLLLSEILLTTLLTGCVYCLLVYIKEPSYGGAILVAGLLSLLTYTKVIAYFLPIVVCFGFLCREALHRNRATMRKHASILLLSGLFVVPWHIRNAAVSGYLGFSTQIERAAYLLAQPSVKAEVSGEPFPEIREKLEREFEDARATLRDPGELHSDLLERGLRVLLDSPLTTVEVLLKGVLVTLLDPGAGHFLRTLGLPPTGFQSRAHNEGYFAVVTHLLETRRRQLTPALLLWVVLAAYYLCGVLGTFHLSKAQPAKAHTAVFIFTLITAYFLLLAGWQGSSRFRVPVTPILCSAAGYGLVSLRRDARPGQGQ